MAIAYGSTKDEAPPLRSASRFNRGVLIGAAGLAVFGAMALLAANPPNRHTVLFSKANNNEIIRDFSGRPVSVPKAAGHVNYAAGTNVNFQGEFSASAHDARRARTQALFLNKAHPNEMIRDFSGKAVSVPKIAGHVNYNAGTNVNFQGEFSSDAHDARAARTQGLFQSKAHPNEMIRDFSGRAVSVPKMNGRVNYNSGTNVNFQGEFSSDAHDARTARIQALSASQRVPSSFLAEIEHSRSEKLAQTTYVKKCIGSVCGDETLDAGLLDQPVIDVAHAGCSKDTDPDCEDSMSPLFMKSKSTQLFSGKAARRDASSYFARQAKPAAVPQLSAKRAALARKIVEKAPAHGLSAQDAAAKLDVYFARQAKLAATPRAAPKGSVTGKLARAQDKKYFNQQAKKIKAQKLVAIGLGAEEASESEIGKAMGVDAMMPATVFESNPAVSQETTDEVNQAIQTQRSDGYTNGDGQDAEDIAPPP